LFTTWISYLYNPEGILGSLDARAKHHCTGKQKILAEKLMVAFTFGKVFFFDGAGV
jgi:hypothetical protein